MVPLLLTEALVGVGEMTQCVKAPIAEPGGLNLILRPLKVEGGSRSLKLAL